MKPKSKAWSHLSTFPWDVVSRKYIYSKVLGYPFMKKANILNAVSFFFIFVILFFFFYWSTRINIVSQPSGHVCCPPKLSDYLKDGLFVFNAASMMMMFCCATCRCRSNTNRFRHGCNNRIRRCWNCRAIVLTRFNTRKSF